MRVVFALVLLPFLAANTAANGCDGLVPVSGTVFQFEAMGASAPIEGVEVSVLEFPEAGTVTTDGDGRFSFPGLPTGENVTFIARHDSIRPMFTGTFVLDQNGLDNVSIQGVSHSSFNAVVSQLGVEVDAGTCQIATTVGKCGATVYDPDSFYQGEPGTTVSVEPSLPSENGPIYFDDMVLVDRELTHTSNDGGVVYYNVPVGDYTLYGHKGGLEFRSLSVSCRAGMLVNAAPPYGVQVDCEE